MTLLTFSRSSPISGSSFLPVSGLPGSSVGGAGPTGDLTRGSGRVRLGGSAGLTGGASAVFGGVVGEVAGGV